MGVSPSGSQISAYSQCTPQAQDSSHRDKYSRPVSSDATYTFLLEIANKSMNYTE